jgi:hypothetical protein
MISLGIDSSRSREEAKREEKKKERRERSMGRSLKFSRVYLSAGMLIGGY